MLCCQSSCPARLMSPPSSSKPLNWYRKDNVLSKMRLAIADAIQKASYGGDRISAKNAAQRIVADIVTQIGILSDNHKE